MRNVLSECQRTIGGDIGAMYSTVYVPYQVCTSMNYHHSMMYETLRIILERFVSLEIFQF